MRMIAFPGNNVQTGVNKHFLVMKLITISLLCAYISANANGPGQYVSFSKANREVSVPPLALVQGTVSNENGAPLVGANVQEKGTNNTVITKENGAFAITVSDNRAILIVSFV